MLLRISGSNFTKQCRRGNGLQQSSSVHGEHFSFSEARWIEPDGISHSLRPLRFFVLGCHSGRYLSLFLGHRRFESRLPPLWRTSWKPLFPAAPLGWWQRNREGMRTPLHRFNNDMVFVDGELLKSAGWEGELDAHSFYIDYQSGFSPTCVSMLAMIALTAWPH